MNTVDHKMHPMMIVAASSVTIASLVAIASMTGYLPGKSAPAAASTASIAAVPVVAAEEIKVAPPVSKAAPEVITEVKPKKVQKEKVAKPSESTTSSSKHSDEQSSSFPLETAATAPAAPPVCNECGIIESVREVKVKAEGSGLGAIAGGVLGGLLGNQVGRGTGKTVATVAAAAGGAYAGHQIEKNVRAEKQVEVTVRFEDGSIRTLPQQDAGRWHQGERVRMSNGQLLPN